MIEINILKSFGITAYFTFRICCNDFWDKKCLTGLFSDFFLWIQIYEMMKLKFSKISHDLFRFFKS